MRKQPSHVFASQPTLPPLTDQHTHEVIIRSNVSTVVIRCFSCEAAEWEARWERCYGRDVEIVEVGA